MGERAFEVELLHEREMEFLVAFDDDADTTLHVDETPPTGQGRGPDAASVLAAAVGQCMSSSLLFCLRKSRVPVTDLRTTVTGRIARNEEGRLRIAGLKVTLRPEVAGDPSAVDRCAEIFEKFCTVARSIGPALEIEAEVVPLSVPKLTAESYATAGGVREAS